MVLRSIARLALAAALTAAVSSPALASPLFTITVSPNPVTGTIGQTVDVDYTIVNDLTSDVVLLDVGGVNAPFSVFFDATSFDGFGTYLAAGASSSGRLGSLRFDGGTPATGSVDFDFNFFHVPPGADPALVLLAYFDDPDAFVTGTDQASVRFQTTQAPPVPEPASLALLAAGLAGVFGVRRRQQS